MVKSKFTAGNWFLIWCMFAVGCVFLLTLFPSVADRLSSDAYRTVVIVFAGLGLVPIWMIDRSIRRARWNALAAEFGDVGARHPPTRRSPRQARA